MRGAVCIRWQSARKFCFPQINLIRKVKSALDSLTRTQIGVLRFASLSLTFHARHLKCEFDTPSASRTPNKEMALMWIVICKCRHMKSWPTTTTRGAIKKTWAETKSEKQWKKTKRKQIHLTDRDRRTEPWRSPRQVYNLLEADTIGPSLEKLLTVWITTPAVGKRE